LGQSNSSTGAICAQLVWLHALQQCIYMQSIDRNGTGADKPRRMGDATVTDRYATDHQ
jgi:hypothetical protein